MSNLETRVALLEQSAKDYKDKIEIIFQLIEKIDNDGTRLCSVHSSQVDLCKIEFERSIKEFKEELNNLHEDIKVIRRQFVNAVITIITGVTVGVAVGLILKFF